MFQRLKEACKGTWYKKAIIIVSLLLASFYPIYKNYYYARGVQQYERHIRFVEANSEFFNPWQYRVLCPLLIEAAKWAYDNSIDKLLPLENAVHFDEKKAQDKEAVFQSQLNNKEAFIYLVIFILFRLGLNVLIYALGFSLFACFTRSNWLAGTALLLVSWSMGNAVHNSDLSFNTYMDLVLFLWMGCVVLYRKNDWWILPITILGALNRETAMLIPGLYFLAAAVTQTGGRTVFGWSWLRIPRLRVWSVTIASLAIFFVIFFVIRNWYGHRAPDLISVHQVQVGTWELVKLNLFSGQALKTYFEIYGVLAILPLASLLSFRYNTITLRAWWLLLVPVWIGIHMVTSMAAESRYYLVPLMLVLLPMLLEMIERQYTTAE